MVGQWIKVWVVSEEEGDDMLSALGERRAVKGNNTRFRTVVGITNPETLRDDATSMNQPIDTDKILAHGYGEGLMVVALVGERE